MNAEETRVQYTQSFYILLGNVGFAVAGATVGPGDTVFGVKGNNVPLIIIFPSSA